MTVVLVTGASRGIGAAIVIEAARAGFTVVATMRNLDDASGLEQALAAEGLRGDIRQLDVTDDASIGRTVTDVLAHHGAIDCVVHNAGVQPIGAIEEETRARALAAFDANVVGPIMVTRAVLPSMRERRRGQIISVTSMSRRSALTGPFITTYAASKAALEQWAIDANKELAPWGISSHAVQLAGFDTAMMSEERLSADSFAAAGSPYRSLAELSAQVGVGLRRALSPASEGAKAVVSLIGVADAPLHSVAPADLASTAQLADRISDADYLAVALAADPRARSAALRLGLSNAASS